MTKLLLMLAVLSVAAFGQTTPASSSVRWYKGNTHTHTLNSDGDSLPEDVVKWYSDNGYNFLVMTDHEFMTPVEPLNKLFGKPGEFLVLHGQEITDSVDKRPQHVNALGITAVIQPKRGKVSSLENLQLNIDAVRSAGGVPQINHPNFGWALTADTISKTKGVMLFELFNGHPLVNNLGGGDSPGTEAIWDSVLSRGRLIYGIATDDVHTVKKLGNKASATPGHGWVMVRATELSQRALLEALEHGDFYASTGVELEDYSADPKAISIKVKEQRWSKYRIQFIGRGGKILQEDLKGTSTYRIRGNEGYVRAKIIESNGKTAWTQPFAVDKESF
jgi:hypothetical protein